MTWRTEGKRPGKAPEPGTHRVGQGRAVNTTTGARNVREHRQILREQAEARNALTPPERRSFGGIRIVRKQPEQDAK